VGDEGEQEVLICFGVGERFADRGRDGALRRDPAGGEGAGQGARGGRAARGSGGGREEDAAAAAILEEAQPREPVDDGGSGGGVAAAPGGLGQCREKDVCDARGGPGGIAALCEREEARDGLGDDVLRRKREEGVELEFSPPLSPPVSIETRSIFTLFSHISQLHDLTSLPWLKHTSTTASRERDASEEEADAGEADRSVAASKAAAAARRRSCGCDARARASSPWSRASAERTARGTFWAGAIREGRRG